MMAFRPLAALAVAAFLASACTGEIMTSELHRANSDSFFRYGAGRGEMLAVVVGNPFPVAKDVLDRAVTDAMQGNHNGPMTQFSTNPGPKADRNQRVVVAFNTPKTMHPRMLCGNPAAIPTGAQEAGKLHADVAFCVESDLYSDVNISIPAVASPNDPRFRHMIASAMWELIPTRDPLSSDNDECFGPSC
jgi:hypothetical protein